MSTRRIDTAWETAQKFALALQPSVSSDLSIFRVRFDSVRQNVSSAMQFVLFSPRQRLYTSMLPLMVTSPGFAPSPATSV